MAVSALSGKMSTKRVTKKRANSDKNVTPVRNRQSLNAVRRNPIIKEA
jgi:hypothetical protein